MIDERCGPRLAAQTCLRRLEPFGLSSRHVADCEISWFGPAGVGRGRRGAEGVVQAMSGIMAVNGRDHGSPLPIGLPVASVAAGVLAAQAVLASLIGLSRGRPARGVRTSVLQAGLLLCSHYIAAATSGEDPWPGPGGPAPGPPFCSLDGHWFEIETLDPEAWRAFWHDLGAGGADLGRAWTRFRARYFEGACSLPSGLHEATSARSLAEIAAVAASRGVSLCPLRSYAEVVGDLADGDAHPAIVPLGPTARSGREVPASGRQAASPRSGSGSGSGLGTVARPASLPVGAGVLPLEGLTVVEATTRMQGPLAGLLLGMLGARVIKVEPPGGDIGRMMAPLAGDNGTFFSCWNRGKETVEVDLAATAGRRQLVDLVRDADVFVHNWRPGRAEQWSLAPQDLVRHNPRLVYARASGWGARPERDHVLGTDFLVQAFSGMGYGLRPQGQPPRTTRVLLTDFMGALVTCEGVLGGLYRRERDGLPQLVGTSLLAGAATLQADVLDDIRRGVEAGRRLGRPLWGPLDVPLRTGDGFLALGDLDADALVGLCRECGVETRGAGADRVATGEADRTRLERLVAQRIGAGTAGEWEERLAAAGVPAAVVRVDLAGLAGDPKLAGLFEALGGTSMVPASPWAFCG